MFRYLIIILVIFALYYYFVLPKIKKAKKKEKERLKDQLLRLFVPEEKLLGVSLHKRLFERTEGKCVHQLFIYQPLRELVAEGRLISETTELLINGQKVSQTVYFLLPVPPE